MLKSALSLRALEPLSRLILLSLLDGLLGFELEPAELVEVAAVLGVLETSVLVGTLAEVVGVGVLLGFVDQLCGR